MHEVVAILTIQAENDTVDLTVEPLSEKIFTMRNKNTSSGINGCLEQILLTNLTLRMCTSFSPGFDIFHRILVIFDRNWNLSADCL